jgi:hypothetical protein
MASRKLLPVTLSDLKVIREELLEIAAEYEMAQQKLLESGKESVEVFGFPTVVVSLQRARTFAASVIGQSQVGKNRLQQLEDEKLKAKKPAEDAAKLKAEVGLRKARVKNKAKDSGSSEP